MADDQGAFALIARHGQRHSTAERLGRAFGVPVTALPYRGQLTVEIDGKAA